MNCILFYGSDVTPGINKYAGPARLATELRDNGFETICMDIGTIQDSSFLPLYEKLINKFVSRDTLWVGFSTTFFEKLLNVPIRRISNDEHIDGNIPHNGDGFFSQVLELCKNRNPNIKFIIGGGRYLNLHKYNFYHFRGNADTEIVEFTKWCKDSVYQPKMNRLGKVISCKEYDRFVTSKIQWHDTDFISPNTVLPIEISRGCIFRCKFCAFPLNGKSKGEWVKHSNILKEELIENYERFGTTEYIFADDTYNDSIEKITDLYNNVFSQLPFQIKWTSYLRLDLMCRFKESADILYKSGLNNVMFGIETNNNLSAKAIGKGLSFEEQIDYIKTLKSGDYKNVLLSSGFIYGLPHDTEETVKNLQDWILSADNPLDNWTTTVLGLNPPDLTREKNSFSEIDLNYKQYGYEIPDTEVTSGRMKWTLPANNLSFDYCRQMAEETELKSSIMPRYRAGSFIYSRFRSMGITESDLFSKSIDEIKKDYTLPVIVNTWRNDYFKKLLEY